MLETCSFDVKNFDVLPNVITKETLSIFEKLHGTQKINKFVKVQTHNTNVKHKIDGKVTISDNKIDKNIYPIVHGTNVYRKKEDHNYVDDMRIMYTNKKHLDSDFKKFAISRGDRTNKFTIIDKGFGVSHDVIYLKEDAKFKFEMLELLTSSKLFKFLMRYSRYTNFNEESVMNRILPYVKIDSNIKDVDEFLNNKFNFTNVEIQYINSNNGGAFVGAH